MRRSSVRELLPPQDGEIGFPHMMNTDAPQSFPRTAYRNAIATTNLRDAGKFAFVRFEGTPYLAQTDPETDFARRAKVGFRP